jgi:glutamate dehydrogenase (NAD(P)+)
MAHLLDLCDDFGPSKIIHLYDPAVPLKAILVIDNVAAGPSIGGVRMAPDVSTEECLRLARAMTLKNSAAGLPHGGGKTVVYADPKLPKPNKERLIRALACAVRDFQEYIMGPDIGTDEECMAWAKDEIGRVVGLPREVGGIPLDEIGATGWGLRHVAEVAAPDAGLALTGARVVVQGFGAVGKHAARFLSQAGARVVAVSDSGGGIYDPEGLNIHELIALKANGHNVSDHPSGDKLTTDELIDIACEVWIPAARPDVINEGNVGRLNTRLVLQGANIPVTLDAEQALHQRGVLCIPDFIANAGGVICAAMEYYRGTEQAALQAIADKLRQNTRIVLDTIKEKHCPPREAAERLALARLKKAMGYGRWAGTSA